MYITLKVSSLYLPKNKGLKPLMSKEKKAVEGWRGLLAISNQPREEKNFLFNQSSYF